MPDAAPLDSHCPIWLEAPLVGDGRDAGADEAGGKEEEGREGIAGGCPEGSGGLLPREIEDVDWPF